MTVTCSDPTPHYASGCELLLAYDANNNGVIDSSESQQAVNDYFSAIITLDEMNFVKDAWEARSINALCPGCYEELAPFSVTDFVVTPLSCEEPCDVDISITWTNTGSVTGTKEVGFTINNKKEWWVTETLDPGQSDTFASKVQGLLAGSYIICPYPDE